MAQNTNSIFLASPKENRKEFSHNIFLKKLLNKNLDSNIIKKDIEYFGKNITSEVRNIFSDEETKKKALDYLMFKREKDKSRNKNKTPKNPARANKKDSPIFNSPYNKKKSTKNTIYHSKYHSMDPKRKKKFIYNESCKTVMNTVNDINADDNINNNIDYDNNINTISNTNDIYTAKAIFSPKNYLKYKITSNENRKNLFPKVNSQENFSNTYSGGFNVNNKGTTLNNNSNNTQKTNLKSNIIKNVDKIINGQNNINTIEPKTTTSRKNVNYAGNIFMKLNNISEKSFNEDIYEISKYDKPIESYLKKKPKMYKENLKKCSCDNKFKANLDENNKINDEKIIYIKKDKTSFSTVGKFIKNNNKLSVATFSLNLINQNSGRQTKIRQLYSTFKFNDFNNKFLKIDKNTNFSLNNKNFDQKEKNGIFLTKRKNNIPFYELKIDEDLIKINKKLQDMKLKINNKEVKFVDNDFYSNRKENLIFNIKTNLKNIENELEIKIKDYNKLLSIHNKLKKENEIYRLMNHKLIEENDQLKEKLTILMTKGLNGNNDEENDGFTLQVSNISNIVNEIESDTFINI